MILHHDTNHTENWCDERLHSVKYSRETPAQAFQMQKDEKCTPWSTSLNKCKMFMLVIQKDFRANYVSWD